MPSTVLVVDDDDDIRDIVSDIVAAEGHVPLAARDGNEALGVLRSTPAIVLVLLDLMMPVLDGYGFREAQLADPAIAHVPVVVMTAFIDVDHARLRAPVLRKPVGFEELCAVLARLPP